MGSSPDSGDLSRFNFISPQQPPSILENYSYFNQKQLNEQEFERKKLNISAEDRYPDRINNLKDDSFNSKSKEGLSNNSIISG